MLIALTEIVLPWPIWSQGEGRPYPYGFYAFVIYIVMGAIYVSVMIIIGYLFLRASKTLKAKKFYLLGLSFLLLGTFDTLHIIGHALFFLFNDSRTPIRVNGTAIYFYPLTTSLATGIIVLYFTLLYVFGAIETRNKLSPIDKVMILMGIVGIAVALNPYNWWHMIPPENANNTIPITGTLILLSGLAAISSLYKYYRILASKIAEDPISEIKLKLFLMGIITLATMMVLMIMHAFLARIKLYYLLLTIITLKLILLIISAISFYLSLIAPATTIMRILRKKATKQ